MAAYVFDTSGIVKRYIHETGMKWVQQVADPTAGNLITARRRVVRTTYLGTSGLSAMPGISTRS